ncbi:DUF3568 family protein [Pseudofrancisella aestuarii]|uniref:DUF3568 family protein n=1 Tax=Pseudofrancisella aestuarii TaxID=2670347 RepID=A0ABV9TCI9_9GAMM|nr:DUF3568 family protein [Pseudofrancisella aestuarii]
MVKLSKFVYVVFIGISILSLSGCITAAVTGDGTKAYLDGTYTMNVKGSITQVYNAALKAVKSNDSYVLVSKSLIDSNAEIIGATKLDSTDFYVDIDKLDSSASKVSIKFGHFGDQAQSSTLMDEIQKNVVSVSKL